MTLAAIHGAHECAAALLDKTVPEAKKIKVKSKS